MPTLNKKWKFSESMYYLAEFSAHDFFFPATEGVAALGFFARFLTVATCSYSESDLKSTEKNISMSINMIDT